MTISREYRRGPYVVQCDDCLDTEELHGSEFVEFVEDAKERGYHPYFEGVWKHRCKACQKIHFQAEKL